MTLEPAVEADVGLVANDFTSFYNSHYTANRTRAMPATKPASANTTDPTT
jgi:hypothetical protein